MEYFIILISSLTYPGIVFIRINKNNISKYLYPTMEFLTTDFWNYLHFLLLVSIFILILKDEKTQKRTRKSRRQVNLFNIKK